MKVSILIAVYNTEKYLPECLDSLLCQTHEDFEALCVDDCSTDGSLAILQQYAERDKRIRVIALKENAGQAKARNKAIEVASGQLICFLDSDDWLAPDTLEKCINRFQSNPKADCVLMRLVKAFNSTHEEEYTMPTAFPLSGTEAFRLSLDWSIHGVYMVKAWLQKEIPYDDTCRSYSDDNTTRLHYLKAREVDVCEGTYYYRQHSASVTHRTDISRINFLLANEHMQQMLCQMKASEDILTLHERVRWFNFLAFYRLYLSHPSSWAPSDYAYAQQEMKRIWNGIDPSRLPLHIRLKPGYMHLSSWTLFRLQQYFFDLAKSITNSPPAR